MKKDLVNILIRIIGVCGVINTWSLYRKKNGTYAVDLDTGNGMSGIYPIDIIEVQPLGTNEWLLLERNVDYVLQKLEYVASGQPVYLPKELNKEDK